MGKEENNLEERKVKALEKIASQLQTHNNLCCLQMMQTCSDPKIIEDLERLNREIADEE